MSDSIDSYDTALISGTKSNFMRCTVSGLVRCTMAGFPVEAPHLTKADR